MHIKTSDPFYTILHGILSNPVIAKSLMTERNFEEAAIKMAKDILKESKKSFVQPKKKEKKIFV